MDPDHPPDIDAEYRLIHGPWPRWALQLGLVRLALRAGAVVVLCMLLFAAAILVATLV